MNTKVLFQHFRFFLLLVVGLLSVPIGTSLQAQSVESLNASVWDTQYIDGEGRQRRAIVSIPSKAYWTEHFRGQLMNFDIALNEGGKGVIAGPVSYTHLTLPTKRIV